MGYLYRRKLDLRDDAASGQGRAKPHRGAGAAAQPSDPAGVGGAAGAAMIAAAIGARPSTDENRSAR
jgi:hypothetical protein